MLRDHDGLLLSLLATLGPDDAEEHEACKGQVLVMFSTRVLKIDSLVVLPLVHFIIFIKEYADFWIGM